MSDVVRTVSAYERAGNVYLQSTADTDRRSTIGYGEVHVVSVSESEALARAVRSALTADYGVVPHPARDAWKDVMKPLLRAAGVRSELAFTAGARALTVHLLADGTVQIWASKPYPGHRKAFVAKGEPVAVPLNAAELGAALQSAIERCDVGRW